jgi:hypothetical protein
MIEGFFRPRDARNCKTNYLRTTKLVKSNKVTKTCVIAKKLDIGATHLIRFGCESVSR